MLHVETVLSSTLDLSREIQSRPALSDMRLVGGTALALQLVAMKLSAAANRGKKKDFIDIVTLLDRYPLAEMFARYQQKGAKIWEFETWLVDDAHKGLAPEKASFGTSFTLAPRQIELLATPDVPARATDRGAERKVFSGQDG